MTTGGKRAAAREKQPFPRRAVAFLLGAVAALALWGYLVWSAIHFGSRARGGNDSDWWLTAAMTVGAMAALFVCLVLVAQAGRLIGLIGPSAPPEPRAPRAPRPAAGERPKGGKRAAR